MKLHNIFGIGYVFAVLSIILSCRKDTEQTDTQETVRKDTLEQKALPQEDELLKARKIIEEKLTAYYKDLMDERMEADDYFAPVVKRFYTLENPSHDKIESSITSGFRSVEKRQIVYSPDSMLVIKEEDAYKARFKGKVIFIRTKDRKKVEEEFINEVVFNSEFQITEYKTLKALQLTSATAGNGDVQAVQSFLNAASKAAMKEMEKWVHPEFGLYFITHPGAMDNVVYGRSIEQLLQQSKQDGLIKRIARAQCTLQYESLPTYNCVKYSREGCFIQGTEEINRLSRLMKLLSEDGLQNFTGEEIESARQAESYISRHVVITPAAMALYFGEIEGKWYLLLADFAVFDCDA